MPPAEHPSGFDQLLHASELIADGLPVDWAALEAELSPEVFASLRQLEAMSLHSRAFNAASGGEATFPDETFKHLSIECEIGRGSRGVVYRAFDPVVQRHVALKLCHRDVGIGEELLAEARAMAEVDHPNVLRVHGAAAQGDFVGFWSDLLTGESLESWAKRSGTLSAAEIVSIGIELCGALGAIHEAGILHGDVKPSNIVRSSMGRWVVVDFGSSSRIAEFVLSSATLLFAAPEVLMELRADSRSDIYSLGVVLFYLATGRCPLAGESIAEVIALHDAGVIEPLGDARPDLAPELAFLIARMLSRDPELRPQSAGAVAGALSSLRSNAGSQIDRGRRRWIVGAALSVAALGAGVYTFPTPRFDPTIELVRGRGRGDALLTGDSIAPGDALSLRYANGANGFVYVLNQDAKGELFKLFPLREVALGNPILATKGLYLPGGERHGDLFWKVTSRGGSEEFYIVVSPTRLDFLEEADELVEATSARSALRGDQPRSQRRGAGGLTHLEGDDGAHPRTVDSLIARVREMEPKAVVRRITLSNQ